MNMTLPKSCFASLCWVCSVSFHKLGGTYKRDRMSDYGFLVERHPISELKLTC